MKRRTKRNSLLLISILSFFIWDLAPAMQDVVYKEARPPRKIIEDVKEEADKQMAAEEKGEAGALYDPTGKTDPFKSFIAEQEEIGEKRKKKPKTYLETLDLSQLELSAIIMTHKGNWAMVRDSKGLGHVIKKGMAIGTSNGVVFQIKDKEVVIREEYTDYRGGITYKDVTKKLQSVK